MQITRNNYMLFFLDYYEGALSEGEQEELMRFLDDHADLKVEFYDFEMVQLPKDKSLHYPDKLSLKKADEEGADAANGLSSGKSKVQKSEAASPAQDTGARQKDIAETGVPVLRRAACSVTPENYEALFAAYAEGDLDAATEQAVEAFAASEVFYARELELMQAARVTPDSAIQYEGKPALKRHYIGVMRRKIIYYSSAAAAVLLMAVMVYNFFPAADTQRYAEETPVAGDKEVPVAVEAPPVPRQDMPALAEAPESIAGEMPAAPGHVAGEPDTPHRLIAEVQAAERHDQLTTPSLTEGPFSLDLTAFRRPTRAQPPLASLTMESKETQQFTARTATLPDQIEPRDEFMWLAYMDPAELPVHDTDDAPTAGRQEVGLAELAINRISENTNLNLEGVGQVIGGERPSLLNLAGEGFARAAPATEKILGIETARNEEGRLVSFAIGNVFSISRR